MNPDTWPGTVDKLLNLNIRVARFHQEPIQDFALDEADERGLMIIDESAIYARSEYINSSTPKTAYLANSKQWIGEWIKGRRNHPSIILWSAENEMWGWLKWLSTEQLKSLGDEIRKYDATRPVIYDGDQDVGDATVNYHYIGGDHQRFPSGSLYQWGNKVFPDKPTGVGEFLYFHPVNDAANYEKSRWWQGLMTRGLRYSNFADIRPYTLSWAWTTGQWSYGPTSPMVIFLKNSLAPVALFDLEYDDLKTDPIMNRIYPNVDEGKNITRNLALYNDEFQNTSVTVEVHIKSGAVTYATGAKTLAVPLGGHIDIPVSYQVPFVGGANLEMELITKKNGAQKFKETKIFKVRDLGLSGNSSSEISFGGNSDPAPSADVNSDTHVNIKDIQACIKVITNSQTDTNIIAKCNALALPDTTTNIKDIQVIIRAIINP